MKRRIPMTCCALLLTLNACDDSTRIDTRPGEAYCGTITLAAQFRADLSPRVQMRMTFDSSQASTGSSAGTITTFDAQDARALPLLDQAALRPMAVLAHDPLSQLQFGDGREKNWIFSVWPADPGAQSLLAIVSLRSDDDVEVRLLRPGASETTTPLFGLFHLARQDGDCGF